MCSLLFHFMTINNNNERNDPRQKNLNPDVMTSRDVIMTSSQIRKEKTADVSTFWATLVVDMYFIQKSNSKHKKMRGQSFSGNNCFKS